MSVGMPPPRRPNRLQEWRKLRGLTQLELAEAVGTTALVIANLELGQRGLSDRWLLLLGRALQITAADLQAPADADPSAELLEVWSRIPAARRDRALAMLRSMAMRAEGPNGE